MGGWAGPEAGSSSGATRRIMKESQEPAPARFPVAVSVALGVTALVTLVGGIFPGSLAHWAVAP